MIARALVVVATAAACSGAAVSSAQAADSPALPGRVEISIGPVFGNECSLGSRDANETANAGGAYRLFSTSTELAFSTGTDLRVGVRVARRLTAEAFGSYARPQLRTSISGDAEGAPAVVAEETVHQLAVGGGVSVLLDSLPGARVIPFVSAGAAYLRELHEGLTLVQTGQRYDVGGGVKIVLRAAASHRLKATGLRLDARASIRTGGVAFDTRAHVTPQFGAAFFVTF